MFCKAILMNGFIFIRIKGEYILYIEISLRIYRMVYERRMKLIKLEPFKQFDFKQLINWIDSEIFNTMVRKCIYISFK